MIVGEGISITMGDGKIELKCGSSTVIIDESSISFVADKDISSKAAHIGLNDPE
ncbi:hypothetical protein HYE60_02495 [Aggregatibacter actinomycetemcomitans]|uniref:hypothetical protein n=1 Tax=Aggregatibacter actinomycetemcomitans TaxID=714 RepID=UPI00197C5902|nr:hypothetical protein [Aggregatibacter actinomycetemcomitans]MBN6074018.1 hypothetical protein [Aggregatibacter actinomycetemcomitans]MBN6074025.1 hypothetical protein [Aggregatibacter actinomycetemcomitans]MBN6074135.1 hypothetical protein [Aggregatibacter actinomycetemcomitans]